MKIAFIGTGNMGGALARAASLDKANELYLINRHPEKAVALQREIGGTVIGTAEAIRAAELIFLGVKPVALPGLCETIRPLLAEKTGPFALVTMVAGVSVSALREMLGAEYPVIRIMPNTPVSVGEGMILYANAAGGHLDGFLHAMRFAGRFLPLEEPAAVRRLSISLSRRWRTPAWRKVFRAKTPSPSRRRWCSAPRSSFLKAGGIPAN